MRIVRSNTYGKDLWWTPAHAVVILDALEAHVDRRGCPVHIPMIDRDEHHVFREEVHLVVVTVRIGFLEPTHATLYLLRPLANTGQLVRRFVRRGLPVARLGVCVAIELAPKERVEVKHIEHLWAP